MIRYHKAAQDYVNTLWCHGKHSYDELNSEELNKLTGLFMQESDLSGQNEFISDTPIVPVLLKKLIDALTKPSLINDISLLSSLKSGAAIHAKSFIDELFEAERERVEQQQLDDIEAYGNVAAKAAVSARRFPDLHLASMGRESCL